MALRPQRHRQQQQIEGPPDASLDLEGLYKRRREGQGLAHYIAMPPPVLGCSHYYPAVGDTQN